MYTHVVCCRRKICPVTTVISSYITRKNKKTKHSNIFTPIRHMGTRIRHGTANMSRYRCRCMGRPLLLFLDTPLPIVLSCTHGSQQNKFQKLQYTPYLVPMKNLLNASCLQIWHSSVTPVQAAGSVYASQGDKDPLTITRRPLSTKAVLSSIQEPDNKYGFSTFFI